MKYTNEEYLADMKTAHKLFKECEALKNENKCYCDILNKLHRVYPTTDKTLYACDVCLEELYKNMPKPDPDDYADKTDFLRKGDIEEELYE